jgi:hypothetical protein
MKGLIWTEFLLLLGGTIFAWTNFGLELKNWLQKKACTTGCAVGLVNPFLTPCFYGAIGFLTAFIICALILKKYTSSP